MEGTQPNLHGHVIGLPLVVLVNAGSASGTEILAGALQDYGRAWLVGERTFGKGSVQTVRTVIGYPELRVRFTSGFSYRPSGAAIQFAGIHA